MVGDSAVLPHPVHDIHPISGLDSGTPSTSLTLAPRGRQGNRKMENPMLSRYTLRVTHPIGASEPASAHPSDHPYTSDRYIAASRPGWLDVPETPSPSTHRLTSTRCTSTRPPGPSSL